MEERTNLEPYSEGIQVALWWEVARAEDFAAGAATDGGLQCDNLD